MPLAPPIPRRLCWRGGSAGGNDLRLASWARETRVRLLIGPLRARKGRVKQTRTSVFGVVGGVPQRLRTIGHFPREATPWGFGLVRSEQGGPSAGHVIGAGPAIRLPPRLPSVYRGDGSGRLALGSQGAGCGAPAVPGPRAARNQHAGLRRAHGRGRRRATGLGSARAAWAEIQRAALR